MRTSVATLALLGLLAGCGVDPSVPQYMQDLPRTEEETLRVCDGQRAQQHRIDQTKRRHGGAKRQAE